MLFNIPAFAASAFALAGLVASSPIQVETASTLVVRGDEPGPSGQLLKPAGETLIPTELNWSGAGFNFVYKPIHQKNPDPDCVNQRQACSIETRWLEVSLVRETDKAEFNLASFLQANKDDPSANIDVWLGVPKDATCGDYRVKVIENQRYHDQWISFQSAAPLVRMGCLRYSGPGQ